MRSIENLPTNTNEIFLILCDAMRENGQDIRNPDLKKLILDGVWHNNSLPVIASKHRYSEGHIQHIASEFWRDLTICLGQKVNMTNFKTLIMQLLLERDQGKEHIKPPPEISGNPSENDSVLKEPKYPSGPLPCNSKFYVNRFSTNLNHYDDEVIKRDGAFLRIEGPNRSGKTSFLHCIFEGAIDLNYRAVYVNLELADFTSQDTFLQCLCTEIGKQLNIPTMPRNNWAEQIYHSSEQRCKFYFERFLLTPLQPPLVIALDNLEKVFDYPHIAKRFIAMLRDFHEEANRSPIWQQLRLVVAFSSELYLQLDIEEWPNFGLPVRLLDLTREQVQDLVQAYELDSIIQEQEVEELLKMLGGNPYLVQLFLFHFRKWNKEVSFDQLLQLAITLEGIGDYLHRLLVLLRKRPESVQAMKAVVRADTGEVLDPTEARILEFLGLVKLHGKECTLSCLMYAEFFATYL